MTVSNLTLSFLLYREWKHFDRNDKNFPLCEWYINYQDTGGLMMTKEQLLKQAAIEWLLKSGNDDVEELLKTATLSTYKEEQRKKKKDLPILVVFLFIYYYFFAFWY